MIAIPAFYAAMRTVAGLVAGLPVIDNASKELVDTTATGDGFFNRPTHHDTWFSYVDSIMWNLLMMGNSFGLFTSIDAMGRPDRTEIVHPTYVIPQYDRQNTFEQRYRIDGNMLGPADVMHFKAATQGGYGWGISPLKHLALTIGIQISEMTHVGRTYEDGAMMTGYLGTDKVMDPDVASEAAEKVAEQIAGRGAGLPALTHGLKWHQVALNHHDLELLAARQWSTTEAAMIIGIPPHLIGAATYDGETYSSVQQDLQLFARLQLSRWRHSISGTLNLHGFNVTLADTNLTSPGVIDAYNAAATGLDKGIITIGEARELIGLPATKPDDPQTDTDTMNDLEVPDDIRDLINTRTADD